MKKSILTFGLTAFLFSGINTPVYAEACTTTVNKVCDFVFPKDGTVETEENYSTCQSIGQGWCKNDQAQNIKVGSLRRAVEENLTIKELYLNDTRNTDIELDRNSKSEFFENEITSEGDSPSLDSKDTDPGFDLDVTCENGTGQIDIIDPKNNSYLSIASISKNGVVTNNITKLLNLETRSLIGKKIMADESFNSDDTQSEIAACLDLNRPQTISKGGVSVCYPDEDTNCAVWEWICVEVLDGELGHNICWW